MSIATQKTVEVGGRTWVLTPAGTEAQFEIECILLRLLGPAAAVMLGAVVKRMAVGVAEFLAAATDVDGAFDLANLESLDSTDPRIRAIWVDFLGVLPSTAQELLTNAMPTLLDRLDHEKILRLMRIVVFGNVLLMVDGKPARVTDFKSLDAALVGAHPLVKWRLLAEAIAFNYATPEDGSTDDGETAAA